MGNENYEVWNREDHAPEVIERIHKDLEFFDPWTVEGTTTDLCCGNGFIGHLVDADFYYDRYPAYKGVRYVDLESFDEVLDGPRIQKADNVYLMHALEHFINPVHTLSIIRDYFMNDGGRLFIAVPNAIYGDLVNGYKPFDKEIGHVSNFTRCKLFVAMDMAGLATATIRQVTHENKDGSDVKFYELLGVGIKV